MKLEAKFDALVCAEHAEHAEHAEQWETLILKHLVTQHVPSGKLT